VGFLKDSSLTLCSLEIVATLLLLDNDGNTTCLLGLKLAFKGFVVGILVAKVVGEALELALSDETEGECDLEENVVGDNVVIVDEDGAEGDNGDESLSTGDDDGDDFDEMDDDDKVVVAAFALTSLEVGKGLVGPSVVDESFFLEEVGVGTSFAHNPLCLISLPPGV